MAAAFEIATGEVEGRAARYDGLLQRFREGLASLEDWHEVSAGESRLPGLLTIELPGVEGEAAMINLDLEGIAVATGSTCALGGTDTSPTLLAMGFSKKRASSTIRITTGEGNDVDSMARAASVFCRVASRLRSLARH